MDQIGELKILLSDLQWLVTVYYFDLWQKQSHKVYLWQSVCARVCGWVGGVKI